ncbi:AsmA family protein [Bordetella avium]|uniref:AsmA family protein n=1 Tax=Bordetella avium TaxID=521 RepID=UPI000E0C3AA3|nr:AsmA family protein [Bordetella avium]RIQ11607.1 AsmA family protein [Bordetella avium]RIQ16241.1 AsmA family protein [Bordetella avium]RIQ30949.1 AsmA family protein [Bordetella avium]RIQ35597.1 AsmA family protein [Bordetella avium]RIQ38875.1 AsmA family protein [Bordetella avium]
MTTRRKILIAIILVLLALPVALVIVVSNLDWNRFKPVINEKVTAAIGRPFAIQGDLSLTWGRSAGWGAYITASDIRIANTDWGQGADLAHIERLAFSLAALPLLRQRVEIHELQFTRPSANLERRADGQANWDFAMPESKGPSSWTVDIGAIGFDQGQIRYRDALLNADLDMQIDPLGKPVPFAQIAGDALQTIKQADAATAQRLEAQTEDYVFGWKVKGQYKDLPVQGEGKAGGMLSLHTRPFPLQAELHAGTTHAAVVGTLTDPMHLGALDLRLQLSGDSMANLFLLTGVTLPDTPPYATDGHLQASLREAGGPQFHYRGFNGKVGASDLHGDISFALQAPRPKLSGQLSSKLLRMADLGPLIGVQSGAGTTARTFRAEGEKAQPQPSGEALPVQTFRTDRWRDMDADIQLSAARILHGDKLPVGNLDVGVSLNDGVLVLNPLRFDMAGGRLDGKLHLDGARTPMQGRIDLGIRRLQLKQMFPGVQAMQRALGELNGDIALSGSGNSVAALLGTANGQARVLLHDGLISRSLMEIAGLNLGNYVVSKLFGDDEVKITCAAADLEMKSGVMTPRLVAFDTENAFITVSGDVNFRNETLDLTISPESKGFRIFSLRSPLYVRGTFEHPDVGVELLPLAARSAGAVALGVLLTPAAALLALVAPSSPQEAKCADLFKRLPAKEGDKKK